MREFLLYVAIDPHASEYLSTILDILWARRFRPGVITHHGPLWGVGGGDEGGGTHLTFGVFVSKAFIFKKRHLFFVVGGGGGGGGGAKA